MTSKEILFDIETRFAYISKISSGIDKYPLTKEDQIEFDTDKDKSKEFAEVFTPLHIVDEMIDTVPDISKSNRIIDLCAGYGQFTVRLLRKFYEQGRFNLPQYITKKHFINELQLSSCYKLLRIFTTNINLAIGSCFYLDKLPKDWHGIWQYIESLGEWVDVTNIILALSDKMPGWEKEYSLEYEQEFVNIYQSIVSRLEKTSKEYKMSISCITKTKTGRKKLLDLINSAADSVEDNWQDKATPEWIVKEMVNAIPDIQSLQRILVLFNVEFIEELIKERGVDPSKIDFGFDSEIEGVYADAIYRVNTLSIGKNLEELKEATADKTEYDLVISNPPYQISDGGHGASAKPVYNKIVEYTIDKLQPRYACFITPSRWMAGGKGLSKYRARMKADKRIRLIRDFQGPSEVFKTVSIAGGVSYFLWDKDYNGMCNFNGVERDLDRYDIVIRDNMSYNILDKVIDKHNNSFLDQKVLHRKPFGLATNFSDWCDENDPNAVACYTNKREIRYVHPSKFNDKHNIIVKWKVYGSGTTGHNGEIFTKESDNVGYRNTFIGQPGQITTETYLAIYTFDSEEEANDFFSYLNTKFFQFMLSLRVISQHINRNKFAFVPDLQDYTREYTDEWLYSHFELSEEEIAHIENKIRSVG